LLLHSSWNRQAAFPVEKSATFSPRSQIEEANRPSSSPSRSRYIQSKKLNIYLHSPPSHLNFGLLTSQITHNESSLRSSSILQRHSFSKISADSQMTFHKIFLLLPRQHQRRQHLNLGLRPCRRRNRLKPVHPLPKPQSQEATRIRLTAEIHHQCLFHEMVSAAEHWVQEEPVWVGQHKGKL
jgi:hypothetical protein